MFLYFSHVLRLQAYPYKRFLVTSNRTEMFSLPRFSRFGFQRLCIIHKRRLMTYATKLEEPIVHAVCWTDPYALLTVANNATFMWRSSASRLVGELFFDQQARNLFHSTDVITFVLLILFFHIKLDVIKQESTRHNDL